MAIRVFEKSQLLDANSTAMLSDSIPNASIPMAAKDFPKKKRANRSSKLKQCKLHARREQWLSQVKNKGCREEPDAIGVVDARNESGRAMGNLERKPRENIKVGSVHHYSDLYLPSNNPANHTSGALGTSGSSRSGGSCSGSVTEEEEKADDECLNDWEAVANALDDTNDKNEKRMNPNVEKHANTLDSSPELAHHLVSEIEISFPKPECAEKVQRLPPTGRAWKPDDAFRPQSLPNLSKQLSFHMNSGCHYGRGDNTWCYNNATSVPSLCPICCEDLDFTDSNFLPCLCGFKLCLFCHKRILEGDGRCPGCRKQYNNPPAVSKATLDGGNVSFQLSRSCSMITRS